MNKLIVFVSGVVVGIAITILTFQYVDNLTDDKPVDGLTMFTEPGDVIEFTQFRVINVIESGDALALAQSDVLSGLLPDDMPDIFRNIKIPTSTAVLLLAGENDHFYDDQIVNVPDGKYASQVGVYRYVTSENIEKTVPVVIFKE